MAEPQSRRSRAKEGGSQDGEQQSQKAKLRKTIVIGLGGTGRQVCQLLKSTLYSEFDQRADLFGHVKLLSIDSDNRTHQIDPRIFGLIDVPLENRDLLELVLPDTRVDPGRYPWFNEQLARLLPQISGEGAAKRRSIGRLLMVDRWKMVYDKVGGLIQELNSKSFHHELRQKLPDIEFASDQIAIYVVGNLVQGTCSGSFLELAYLLNVLNDRYREVKPPIAVFTLCAKSAWDQAKATNMVAALRELNHFSNPEVYGDEEQRYFIDAPSAESILPTEEQRRRAAPPFQRVFLVDLDAWEGSQLHPDDGSSIIARFLYHMTGTVAGAHYYSKVVDSVDTALPDLEGSPQFCSTLGAVSIVDPKAEVDLRCAYRLAEQVIQCISGEGDVTPERVLEGGFDNDAHSSAEVLRPITDRAAGFAAELDALLDQKLATVRREPTTRLPAGVGIAPGSELRDGIVAAATAAFQRARPKEPADQWLQRFESSEAWIEQLLQEIREQIRDQAYVHQEGLHCGFDQVRQKLEDEAERLSNVLEGGEPPGNLGTASRFLRYLAGSSGHLSALVEARRQEATTGALEKKERDLGSLRTKAKNAYHAALGAHGFNHATVNKIWGDLHELTKSYYRERVENAIRIQKQRIFDGHKGEREEVHKEGILALARQSEELYRQAYEKVSRMDDYFREEYYKVKQVKKPIGVIALDVASDEAAIYAELFKDPSNLLELIEFVLREYANNRPRLLLNVDVDQENELRTVLRNQCLERVRRLRTRPPFEAVYSEDERLRQNVPDHLRSAAPLIKFSGTRSDEVGFSNNIGESYCVVTYPDPAPTFEKDVENNEVLGKIPDGNRRFMVAQPGANSYAVHVLTARHGFNPSIADRVNEEMQKYYLPLIRGRAKGTYDPALHTVEPERLTHLGGDSEERKAVFHLGLALGYLHLDVEDDRLSYRSVEEDVIMGFSSKEEVPILKLESQARNKDQVWKCLATAKSASAGEASTETVQTAIVRRVRRDYRSPEFMSGLAEGLRAIGRGEIDLYYTRLRGANDSQYLVNTLSEYLAKFVGERPKKVHEALLAALKPKPARAEAAPAAPAAAAEPVNGRPADEASDSALSPSEAQRIRDLKDLFDQGILTEEQFQRGVERIVGMVE